MLTEDGNEVVVQTNYLAHFLLTHLLKVRQGYIYIFISSSQEVQSLSYTHYIQMDKLLEHTVNAYPPPPGWGGREGGGL